MYRLFPACALLSVALCPSVLSLCKALLGEPTSSHWAPRRLHLGHGSLLSLNQFLLLHLLSAWLKSFVFCPLFSIHLVQVGLYLIIKICLIFNVFSVTLVDFRERGGKRFFS